MTQCVDLRADALITEKLLLLQLMTELLALHLVIWWQMKHGTIVSAVEIMHDLIKSDLNDEPDSDETNYCNIESQAYEKLFEFI